MNCAVPGRHLWRECRYSGAQKDIGLPSGRVSVRLNSGLRVHGGEEMLAALVKNFIRESRVNVCNSTRKQQGTDHLAEQSDRLPAAALADPLRLFDDLGELFEVRRETFHVRAARHVAEPSGVAYKTRQGAPRIDIRTMLGREVPLDPLPDRIGVSRPGVFDY